MQVIIILAMAMGFLCRGSICGCCYSFFGQGTLPHCLGHPAVKLEHICTMCDQGTADAVFPVEKKFMHCYGICIRLFS